MCVGGGGGRGICVLVGAGGWHRSLCTLLITPTSDRPSATRTHVH